MLSSADSDPRITRLRESEAIGQLKRKKLGLVLAGGGAKGAYQAGCLEVLQESGIFDFHVIVGTSVGALNASAVASRRIPELVALWRGLNFFKVFRPSWRAFFLVSGVIVAQLLVNQPFMRVLFAPTGRIFSRLTQTWTSVAEQSELRRMLERVLYPNDSQALQLFSPVFATIAVDGFWFDPDWPTFRTEYFGGDVHLDITQPIPAHGWLPNYIDLSSVSKTELLDTLLMSAALPFAFRRFRLSDGRTITDGGMVDNVPLSKALEYDCDTILIIHTVSDPDLPNLTRERLIRLRRMLRVARTSEVAKYRLYRCWLRKHDRSGWRYFHLWDLPKTRDFVLCRLKNVELPEILHVIPSRNLGGIVRGTVNFSNRKARQTLTLGREDMIHELEKFAGFAG